MRVYACLLICLLVCCKALVAQPELKNVIFQTDSLAIKGFGFSGQSNAGDRQSPLLSFQLGEISYRSNHNTSPVQLQWIGCSIDHGLLRGIVRFTNQGNDTLMLHNVVPFATDTSFVYITGRGNHELSRTHLFIPGRLPVNVIVPDNAWDLGFSSVQLDDSVTINALVRRNRASIQKGSRNRFETTLFPGGSVTYNVFMEANTGGWREGITQVFQKRMLYDVDRFDNSIFERPDLSWIRHTYVMHLMMAWDRDYYDPVNKRFTLDDFVRRGRKLYGGDDIISLWPTWPTLGLDQRNQFDLFRDLPGGTPALRALTALLHKQGTRLFVCYNPWDESTRSEDHFAGISNLIAETSADGIVLDTKGESSKELQRAADRVKPGVIMYSEGMAVPKDMQGIPSGRVHNALYYPPMLNLNKLIKPDFAIYRVAELAKEPIRREFATSFFNGYGTEINIMSPGKPDWIADQYAFLGRTSRILRENTTNFTRALIPLVQTSTDSIWVNEWPSKEKTIYTIYSIRPDGYQGPLFEIRQADSMHYVDIWHHRLLEPVSQSGRTFLTATTDAFNRSYLGTNNEGAVDCIAAFPKLVSARRKGNRLELKSAPSATELRVWAGKPDYDKSPLSLEPGAHLIDINEHFGRFEGDLIIQLLRDGILVDETIVTIPSGETRKVSERWQLYSNKPDTGMVEVPGGRFTFKASHGDEFIPYPNEDVDSIFDMPSFYMDRYPVTNAQFQQFMQSTHYRPADTANFLKHWKKGRAPKGQEQFPVVYVSYEDAKAYARWAKKRLPSEIEWQYAAQTSDGNEWPWKQSTPVTRKTEVVTNTLSTIALEGIDSSRCNLGDGRLHAVGSYPAGVNPNGLFDLVGSVWQLTNDEYMSSSYKYIILKGGSYYKPSSSWWYVQGGPRELHYRQQLLRVSQGFERNATVGFRCVRDIRAGH